MVSVTLRPPLSREVGSEIEGMSRLIYHDKVTVWDVEVSIYHIGRIGGRNTKKDAEMMLQSSCDTSIIQAAGTGEYKPSAEPTPAAVVHFFTSI
jgi:hypothetical protein